MIVLDAGVLIAHLDSNDSHHDSAEQLLIRDIDDLQVNSLTLAEVLVAPTRDGRLDAAMTAISDLGIGSLASPSNAALRLAQLRVDTGLKMSDCCVLLSAEDVGARLATFDGRLAQAGG